MRIACVHIPQFALQTLTRIDPSLRGAAVAVVGSGSIGTSSPASLPPTDRERARATLYGPIVHACSRAAWALGVRLGMTGTAAAQIAGLRVVTADASAERETVRALADALLGSSEVVDNGGRIGAGGAHLAMYCEVPAKTRGAAFGERLVELCGALGVIARIGIADDRFTAWVAASSSSSSSSSPGASASSGTHVDEGAVISVPRGGSAAFLSPRPLSLLAITPEVQHMLESLGVRTLGEFAALPAPSVARPIEADYRGLARGESGHSLRPYTPESPIREDITLAPSQLPATGEANGLSTGAAVGVLAERLALRLAGRGRGAARVEITIHGPAGEKVVPIVPGVTGRGDRALPVTALEQGAGSSAFGSGRRVIESVDDLADSLALALSIGLGADNSTPPYHLRATVTIEALVGDALSSVIAARGSSATVAAHSNLTANVLGTVGNVVAMPVAVSDEHDTSPFHTRLPGEGANDLFARAAEPVPLDVLGVVLSSTGSSGEAASRVSSSGGWSLVRDERRDSHRRMTRGKSHRRRSQTVDAQVRMFGSSGADRKA